MANSTTPNASNPTPQDVNRQLFDKAKRRDEAYFASFTENALYQVANYPPVYGEKGIREFLVPILNLCEGVDHFIDNMWEIGDNKMVCQGSVVYHRRDHKVVPRIYVCNIIQVEGDKIRELRAYGDFTPLFNPPE
jgi:limonene-1,2-epoxide hydrolase